MKKGALLFIICVPLFFLIVGAPGCVKDNCKKTYSYTYYEPVYKTEEEVLSNIKSNPAKETENPGKIYMYGKYIFLNEIDKGIHVIDNSNPASPQNIAFIDIPGNGDLAVQGNTLYADMFTGLAVIDITNPENVVLKKMIDNVFPERAYGTGFVSNPRDVVTEWIQHDTTVTVDCDNENYYFSPGPQYFFADLSSSAGSDANKSVSPIGKGGSMARFAITNERLYSVSSYELSMFDITDAANPTFTRAESIGWGVETIFPFKNKLFIGTQTGMLVYNIDNPDIPHKEGEFAHVQSCDPVIADDNYAYVTLRSGTTCQGFSNELDVLSIDYITKPQLKKVYQFTNPHGLSKEGNILFVCDGADGLKVYDASDVMDLKMLTTISNLDTYDVIAFNNIALVVAKDGLYQFDYSNPADIRQLSKITIVKK